MLLRGPWQQRRLVVAMGFIWDLIEQDFQEGLSSLAGYKAQHGHVRVPARFKTEDGFTLGSWVAHHRREYMQDKLFQERIDALEALGFIWDLQKK